MTRFLPNPFLFGIAILLGGNCTAEAQSMSSNRAPLNTGYLYNFETSVDDGGDVSSHFFHVRGTAPLHIDEGRFIGISAAYYLNSYSFSGGPAGSFTALEPWNRVHTIRLSTPIRWRLDANWDLFAVPMIRSLGENGANFSDTISGGGLAGVSYQFGERLALGPGFGYITQLEDDASIFPIILVDWKITDALSLSTGPTVGATLGPGLSLVCQLSDRLQFGVGARYEKLRFRLDEDSAASPGGIGEDRGIPVFGALTYRANDNLRLSVIGGVGFGDELKLDDAGGGEIRSTDTSASPFVGVNAAVSF